MLTAKRHKPSSFPNDSGSFKHEFNKGFFTQLDQDVVINLKFRNITNTWVFFSRIK